MRGRAGLSCAISAYFGLTIWLARFVVTSCASIARDLASEGIRVNTILPGIFETPLMNGAPPQVKEALAASVPFPKRLGLPTEYASLALEMIKNGYFNGEDVRLDGSIRMAPR